MSCQHLHKSPPALGTGPLSSVNRRPPGRSMHAQALHAASLTEPLRQALAEAITQINLLVLGKPREVRLAFATLIAGGHLLIEDLPGLGKTTLARSLAATLGLDFQRMQFT